MKSRRAWWTNGYECSMLARKLAVGHEFERRCVELSMLLLVNFDDLIRGVDVIGPDADVLGWGTEPISKLKFYKY